MDAEVQPARGARRSVPTLERVLFAALAAATIAFWATHYHPFLLPNNDFASFEAPAQALLEGRLPASFLRMPLFPALMAALAPWMPGPHPFLEAALLLNAALSLGLLVAVYVFSARAIGPGALLVAVLLATSEQFQLMALQPLVEPLLGLCVVATFLALQAGSRWQWVAAGAAALCRVESLALLPVLVAAHQVRGRSLVRGAGLAALAAAPALAWVALGAARGAGVDHYMGSVASMSFRGAPEFLLRELREPFAGWYPRGGTLGMAGFALAVLAPLAWGLRAGWREFPREASALVAYLCLHVGTVVVFGIAKARYVYPTEWILLLFWSLGALRLAEVALRRVPIPPAALGGGALVGAAALLALVGRSGVRRILAADSELFSAPATLAYGAVALLLAGAGLVAWTRRGPARRAVGIRAAILTGLGVLALPMVAGGLAHVRRDAQKIYYDNFEITRLADWMREGLSPGERIAVLPRAQVLFLADEVEPSRVVAFSAFEARDPETLAAEMRARDVRYAAYTWRKPNPNPGDVWNDRVLRADLARLFQGGGPVPGFEHVATVDVPEELHRDDVQIYRVSSAGSLAGSSSSR